MEKTILIGDTASPLAKIFVDKYPSQENEVVITFSSKENNQGGSINSNSIIWNRKSPLSAVTVVRKVETSYPDLLKAVIFFSPENIISDRNMIISDIEKIIDSQIKAYLFFIKEISSVFTRKKKGTLIPVLYKQEGNLSFYHRIAAAAFQELIDQLIRDKDLPFCVLGIDAGTFNIEETIAVVENIATQPSSKTSKWIRPDKKAAIKSVFNRKKL